jgi:tagatose-6-phosphate ketose/aldose isomerase
MTARTADRTGYFSFQFVTFRYLLAFLSLADYFVLLYQRAELVVEMTALNFELVEWLQELAGEVPVMGQLLSRSEADQLEAGYYHTLREICQQPITWKETADRAVGQETQLRQSLEGTSGNGPVKAIILTGSGSSFYAGECLAPALQEELELPVTCVTGGAFLTHGRKAAPPCHPCLFVSLARSGDSPESCEAVNLLLEQDAQCRHLLVTCNKRGKLAVNYRDMPGVFPLILDDGTNDRSLVMTSSFTNMILATRYLGFLGRASEYRALVARLRGMAREMLIGYVQRLAELGGSGIELAVYLGSGSAYGAAREAALKMLEMSGGRVKTLVETYLGFRHGPMAVVHPGALVVCFLSSSNRARAYELDLLRELDRKQLGARKVVVGEEIPEEVLQEGDLGVTCPGLNSVGDHNAPLVDILAGQVLAFFQCMAIGLQPDAPSAKGIINRVVEPFPVY